MASYKWLLWPIRLPFRLLMIPIQKSGMIRFVFVTLSGNPREIIGRARVALLLRKMGSTSCISTAELERLVDLLDTYPRAISTHKIALVYLDEHRVRKIYNWWHKPEQEAKVMGMYPNPLTVLTWPRLGREEQFYAIAAVAIILLLCGTLWAAAHLSLWWLVTLPVECILYLAVGVVAAGLEYFTYLDRQYDVDF